MVVKMQLQWLRAAQLMVVKMHLQWLRAARCGVVNMQLGAAKHKNAAVSE